MKSLSDYIRNVEAALRQGNATEHTHRPALKTLLQSIDPGITATNEPKRIACGAPDFILTRGQVPIGYVEAKDVGVSLAEAEKSPQLVRYRSSLSNLILTDYLEFRWYHSGQPRLTARLAAPLDDGTLQIDRTGAEQVKELLHAFLNTGVPTISTARELAERMAALARLTNGIILRAIEDEDKTGSLHQQMEAFRIVLLHELTTEQFADMYAQTMAYGLFAARVNVPTSDRFTRKDAAYDLPKTNPFLRKMFGHLAGPGLDPRIEWVVDDLAELLHRTDMHRVLKDFGRHTRKEDPVVHFYETFLTAYNPELREKRGVYYTPEPVVSYIVRSVDYLLRTAFKLKDGLADTTTTTIEKPAPKKGPKTAKVHRLQILDPATGTGTFLYSVIDRIHERLAAKKQLGTWSGYVSDHLIPRLFGFELLMTPYTVAHMKLGLQLSGLGYDFKAEERLGIYLTNTLDEVDEIKGLPLFGQWLAEEANAANSVKRDAPVMVVLGNPPYSGHSENTGRWIVDLLHGKSGGKYDALRDYFAVEERPLGEKNPKWLHDDYVKFIRFAQWRIDQTGEGILAFICNHGYIDNPTFRGMRESLLTSFDDIYILDLHGSAKKREVPPSGGPDKNVFDIQQGVAIGLFVKRTNKAHPSTKVNHAHLWGIREDKYGWLEAHDISNTRWKVVPQHAPSFLFIPQDPKLRAEYEAGWPITEAMPVYVLGFQTHRDDFAIALTEEEIHKRILDLRSRQDTDEKLRSLYDLKDGKGWKVAAARSNLRALDEWEQYIARCLYRPFDWRHCYFHAAIMDRPRRELTDHVFGKENLCLLLPRQIGTQEWRHASVADGLAESCVISTKTKEQNYNFPLYTYPPGIFAKQKEKDAKEKARA